MCGIAGALTLRGDLDLEPLVSAIIESQTRRGPDHSCVRVIPEPNGQWVFGHNRLSIIDLRPEANQPMVSLDGEITIVFNGEIYNYVELREELVGLGFTFRTQSDTEVLIAAFKMWGEQAFERLYGMFAVAIADRSRSKLLLARDRFGVKPLFYWTDGRTLVFGSTPSVIARWAGAPPNLEYVGKGIRYKYYEDDSDTSQYVGVSALVPGTLLAIDVSHAGLQQRITRYYDLRTRSLECRAELNGLSDRQLEDRLLELLDSACALRLRADVPLGISVSGGLDSSAIAAVVSKKGVKLTGYSFSHPDALESEGPLVSALGRNTGVRPFWVWVQDPKEVRTLFWETLRAQDAPFPHATVMAQNAVFRAAREDGTVVLLGGQGGDEAFMGYRKFYLFYAQSIARNRRLSELPHFLRSVIPFLPAVSRRAGTFMVERSRYTGRSGGMGTQLKLPLATHNDGMGMSHGQSIFERQVLDITRFSLPTLLRYEDRNSMGNSIESRLPFMDHRLVEFGIALMERHKLAHGFGKWILRNALKGTVPDVIRLNRDKRGFDVNQGQWIRQGLGAEIRQALSERSALVREFTSGSWRIEEDYSDLRLISDPQAFKEAVSLIWLADRA